MVSFVTDTTHLPLKLVNWGVEFFQVYSKGGTGGLGIAVKLTSNTQDAAAQLAGTTTDIVVTAYFTY
jgi:hypothetical protein